MAETEEEERDAKRNTNNMTMDTLCHWYPVITNTQGKITNVTNARSISSDILAETIKGFNGLMIQSTINYYVYYNSEEDDAEINPNSDLKVDTQTSDEKKRKVTDTETTNGNSPCKLLINRIIPETTPFKILPIDQPIAYDAVGSGEILHARCKIISKDIVTGAARSAEFVFWTPADKRRQGTDGTTLGDRNTAVGYARLNSPVRICGITTSSPIRTGN